MKDFKGRSRLILVLFLVALVVVLYAIFFAGNSKKTEDISPVSQAIVEPTSVPTFELGAYKVQSNEFDYMSTNLVNLWQSYSNRTKVGSIKEGEVVEVIQHDSTNDYCRVKAGSVTGWASCGWLVKAK